ncbi:MAG: SAM-dependent methyltransferase [Spirochaetota bacterium]
MDYYLNTTIAYHTEKLNTLGWELTVCNSLQPENTPLRKILFNNQSYGNLLYEFLSQFIPLKEIKKVIEIGGGYGYLMKDFLDRNSFEACMVDISNALLEKQKETLRSHTVSFRNEDFLETEPDFLKKFDLAILNENLGDFPTLVNLNCELFNSDFKTGDPDLIETRRLFKSYILKKPESDKFNFNLGALKIIEKLCASGIPYIFCGEHSCEAAVPDNIPFPIYMESKGIPEKISLMGHDEYTIKLSYLQKVAEAFGYSCRRGPFADYIPFELTDKLIYIMKLKGSQSDEAELICQFIEDLYKYEYLLLIRKQPS